MLVFDLCVAEWPDCIVVAKYDLAGPGNVLMSYNSKKIDKNCEETKAKIEAVCAFLPICDLCRRAFMCVFVFVRFYPFSCLAHACVCPCFGVPACVCCACMCSCVHV